MDPLSSVLAKLRMQSSVIGDFSLAGDWGISHPQIPGVCMHLIINGCFKVAMPGHPNHELGAGDVVIFPRGNAHSMVTDRAHSVRPVVDILRLDGHSVWVPDGRYERAVHRYVEASDGPKAHVVDVIFGFHDSAHHPLLMALPDIIVMPRETADLGFWIEAITAFISQENECGGFGQAAATGLVADLLFVQAMRAFVAFLADRSSGWIHAITHHQTARALDAIHSQPAAPWTVASLARLCHMSRAKFARDFMQSVGQGPIAYLTDWRMHLAACDLASGIAVAVAASRSGYASDTAFTRAFRRNYDVSPARYREAVRTALGSRPLSQGA